MNLPVGAVCTAMILSACVFAGEGRSFKGSGVAFDFPDGFTVNEQPRKDGSGSTLVATNSNYSRTLYIRTYDAGFDPATALTETKHREAVISGIPLSKWSDAKRKISGEERAGHKADFAEVVVETYVFKLGEKLVSVTLSRRSKDSEESETLFAVMVGSLKAEAK